MLWRLLLVKRVVCLLLFRCHPCTLLPLLLLHVLLKGLRGHGCPVESFRLLDCRFVKGVPFLLRLALSYSAGVSELYGIPEPTHLLDALPQHTAYCAASLDLRGVGFPAHVGPHSKKMNV